MLQSRRFWILLFVREKLKDSDVHPKFVLRIIPEVRDAGIDLEEDDLLHNFTTAKTQLMNGKIPWRGAREKDPRFLQILVEASTDPGDVVLDYNASTGMPSYPELLLVEFRIVKLHCEFRSVNFALQLSVYIFIWNLHPAGASVHACRSTGRHLIALESDAEIFNGVLNALKDPQPRSDPNPTKRQPPVLIGDDDKPAQKVKRQRFCK